MSRSRQIFLDHAATTPVRPDVLGVMLPYFGNHFGNPGSAYELGERSQNALEEARRRVASLIQAHPDEIIFTSGGTESANLAIIGYCLAHREQGRHIITSSIEHNAVLKSCRHLEEIGFEVSFLGVDAHGVIDSAELEGAIRQDTILISVMHGNNETGTLQPASKIGRIARSRNIAFHTDAAQSLGKIPINVDDLGITLLSASSHKIYGPKGVGALYVRRGTALAPMIFGSGQEQGLRPGTVNLPAIVGFGKACELASSEVDQYTGTVRTLRDTLQDTILTRITGARILGHPEQRLPHILCTSFPGVEGDSIAAWLDVEGIAVGSGASVFSKSSSHVFAAMGIPPEQAFGTIRVSLGWENTQREIERTARTLEKLVTALKRFSEDSPEENLGVITFPSRRDAVRTARILGQNSISHTVICRPKELRNTSGTHIAIAYRLGEKDRIGNLLGTAGIEFSGMHALKTLCRDRSRKEEAFWNKVEEIQLKKREE